MRKTSVVRSSRTTSAIRGDAPAARSAVAAQFPSLQVWPLRCTGYKIQHYRKNEGHFKWHFDALGRGAWERQLAMVAFLTFWTHMHCGEIPRSEDKYIVSSFLCFDIPAAEPES